MRTLLSVILILIAPLILHSQELPCKSYYSKDEGGRCQERYKEDSEGNVNGKYISYYSDGSVKSRGELIHGNKQGNWMEHVDLLFSFEKYVWYEKGEVIAVSDIPISSYAEAKQINEVESKKQIAKEKVDLSFQNSSPCSFANSYPDDPRSVRARELCDEERKRVEQRMLDAQRNSERQKIENAKRILNENSREILFGNQAVIIDHELPEQAKQAELKLYSRYKGKGDLSLSDTVFYFLLKWSGDAEEKSDFIKYYETKDHIKKTTRVYFGWQYLKYLCELNGCSEGTSNKMALDTLKSLIRKPYYAKDNRLFINQAALEIKLHRPDDAIRTLGLLNAINYNDVVVFKYKCDPVVIRSFLNGVAYLLKNEGSNLASAKRYFVSFQSSATELDFKAASYFVSELGATHLSLTSKIVDRKLGLLTRESLDKFIQKK